MTNAPDLNSLITQRQKKLLKLIIETYIKNNNAISSSNINQNECFSDISSATIRNDMSALEKVGYLKKEYKSAGRVPTKKGYKFYIDKLMKGQTKLTGDIKDKLSDILSNRKESIDITIDKSVELISEFLNLPAIVIKRQTHNKELLKKIDITHINKNEFIIFLITSSGAIYKNDIIIEPFLEREDLHVCIQAVNEKLIDIPISEISTTINKIIPELRMKIQQFEWIYNSIISKLINKAIKKEDQTQIKFYNSQSIVAQPEYKKNEINLKKIFYLLENYSTFSALKHNYMKCGKTLINLDNNLGGISLAGTKVFRKNNTTHELTIIGPTRMNYPLIKYLLEFINEKISE